MIFRDETINGKRHCRVMCDSIADVQRWLKTTPRVWSSASSNSNGSGHSWDLGVGYVGAEALLETGWREGAKDLGDRLAAYMPPRDKADSWRYDIAGELPDIGRFLAGDPAHMKRHGHPKGHHPIISIAVNIRVQCTVKASAMANYGAAMVAIIDKLEHSGRRVELAVTFASTMRHVVRVSCGWTVKQADDPVDLAAVAFSLAHPSASRRIGFAMAERMPKDTQCGSYGFDLVLDEDDLIDPMPGTYCIEGLRNNTSRCLTLDDALVFVAKQINDAAGEDLVTV